MKIRFTRFCPSRSGSARFANAQSLLLPGMYVTAQFAQAVQNSAILVPQTAITRDPQGNATLFVVGPGNRAIQRTIQADRTIGANWVVTGGLAPGEKVITQGTANLKDGAQIRPTPTEVRTMLLLSYTIAQLQLTPGNGMPSKLRDAAGIAEMGSAL